MRFWDSSALLAVLGVEDRGRELALLLDEDPEGMIWVLTPVEVRSGLARRVRTGAISSEEREIFWETFVDMRASFSEIDAASKVRDRAQRLVDDHPLRAGDAMQLGAAILGARGAPERLPLVTLDRRLSEAAAKEGFPILPPLTGEGILGEGMIERRPRKRDRRTASASASSR